MTNAAVTEILKQKGIYITSTRVMVLKTIYEHKGTINAAQIQKESLAKLDRISVYRTLQVFLKNGLILAVPNVKGWPKYLVKDIAAKEDLRLYKVMVYFICESCGTVKAMPTLKNIGTLVPNDHTINTSEVIIEGICGDCLKQ